MSALHARTCADGSTTPAQRYSHADLVRLVGDAINSLTLNGEGLDLAADLDLRTDLQMDGWDILSVFERLAEWLGLQLWPAMALDLLMAGPTIGRLARVLAQQLHEQGQKEDTRHA
jgi:hypothetical protein